MNIPCYLWPLIAGLICAILGYLLGRLTRGDSNVTSNSGDLDALRSQNAKLEADFSACRSKRTQLELDLAACKSKANASMDVSSAAPMAAAAGIVAGASFDGDAAKLAFGKKIKQDDLKIVEGIGPKIEELFNNAGIKTWAELADASFERCKGILADGGDRFRMHNPATWPDQSKMANEGKFAELKKWQDELDGGK